MSKICNKCLHYYDDKLDNCPYCSKETNVKNLFEETEINKDLDDNVYEENDKKEKLPVENTIEEKKNKGNKLIKTKKRNKASLYSYIVLILSLILLFIIALICTISFDLFVFIHYVATSFLLILTYRLSLDSKNGYYLGIFASLSMIFMIIEKDYTNFIVGIYLFFSSFTYLRKK